MTPQAHLPSSSLRALFATFHANGGLARELVIREVLGRYRGASFGVLWALFSPLLMLTVYTFVFGTVFKARWTAGSDSQSEFALALFIGLIVFNLLSECLTRAPHLIISNPNYVKKVVFPLEILPVVTLGAALFHAGVSLLVWLAFYGVAKGVPPATVFWLPVVLAPFLLLVLGLSWFLASLTVFVRDVAQMIGLVMTVLMFMSPVFYPASALPASVRGFFNANPLTPTIEMVRGVMLWGQAPSAGQLVYTTLIGSVATYLGFRWFQKTRRGFADVL